MDLEHHTSLHWAVYEVLFSFLFYFFFVCFHFLSSFFLSFLPLFLSFFSYCSILITTEIFYFSFFSLYNVFLSGAYSTCSLLVALWRSSKSLRLRSFLSPSLGSNSCFSPFQSTYFCHPLFPYLSIFSQRYPSAFIFSSSFRYSLSVSVLFGFCSWSFFFVLREIEN